MEERKGPNTLYIRSGNERNQDRAKPRRTPEGGTPAVGAALARQGKRRYYSAVGLALRAAVDQRLRCSTREPR
jgi:hypothetical protein